MIKMKSTGKLVLPGRKPSIQKSKLLCNYVHRVCMQNRLEGYDYCIRHILEDKNAPFRQCSYIYPQTRRRCMYATQRNEKKESMCSFHAKMSLLAARTHQLKALQKPVESPQTILEDLEHYCKTPHAEEHMELVKRRKGENNYKGQLIPDLQLDNKLKDTAVIDDTWVGEFDSDAESMDGDIDDPLKYAGVYTTEEAVSILRDKLIRLQYLYIEQFKWLQHVLRERRRDFVHGLKKEKEIMGSIHEMPLKTTEDFKSYRLLKALKQYHQHSGVELVLHHKEQLKRKKISTPNSTVPVISEPQLACTFTENGKRCPESVIPLSSFCLKHILKDPYQVLFAACASKSQCDTPIIPHSDKFCHLHRQMKKLTQCVDKAQLSALSSQPPEAISETEVVTQEIDAELFESMDDIASLGLDAVQPGLLFGLDQFGDPGETMDVEFAGETYAAQPAPAAEQPPPLEEKKTDEAVSQ